MRNAVRFTGLFLVVLLSLVPVGRAQEHSDGEKDQRKDVGKKHALTFQIIYSGNAQRSSTDGFVTRETSIEVEITGTITETKHSHTFDTTS